MKTGGIGGGNTRTGLNFENERDLLTAISHAPGYSVAGSVIYYRGREVARSYKKHALYRMLAERGINYRDHLSKKLLPDDAIYVIVNNTMFIIELKFQKPPDRSTRNCRRAISKRSSTASCSRR